MASNDRRSSPSGAKTTSKFVITADHGTITTATVATKTATITGLRTTDAILCANAQLGQKTGLAMAGYRVSAANEIEISLANPTGASITSGTVTYTVVLGRFST